MGSDTVVGMSSVGSLSVAMATVATALGACAIAASVMSPISFGVVGYWLIAGAGVVALLGGLAFLAVSFGRRDSNLR
jgi:hypothetical protein